MRINVNTLFPDSGLEIVIYDNTGMIIRQTMLGLIVKQNATREDYEVPVTIELSEAARSWH